MIRAAYKRQKCEAYYYIVIYMHSGYNLPNTINGTVVFSVIHVVHVPKAKPEAL
jgi:hypothetical protein